MEGRRYRAEHTSRGERLVAEYLVAAGGASVIELQCQAPAGGFAEVAAGCDLVEETLLVDTGRPAAAGR
jgi:hypothetical protein